MVDRLLTFDAAVGLLKSGGVLLLGTDTVPGFHCRADMPDSVARIQTLKGRGSEKSMLVLAGSVDQAGLVTGTLDERQSVFCRRCWPGPFSLILPASKGQTVAVRVPALESLRSLVLSVGFPLVSTSANRSGESPCPDFKAALADFSSQVDGGWNPRESRGEAAGSTLIGPSALIDLTSWPPVQLRQGPLNPPPS
ncbi:MAG: L-threonylcarbamoyladenylate synthase [Candidatus Krumholzibacteria bacterium]|nr:L-threonylcarbamoyladenylate synthase [Candidatus Krumholzibacteria bacterium]